MPVVSGDQILAAAEKYTGVPYFEGNPQGRNGMDCSGIVQAALADLGIKIARTTTGQLADANTHVVGTNIGTDIGKAQLGDILHYTGHEEIWIGTVTFTRGQVTNLVFSEATAGTRAARRQKTPWPLIGIVRYAGAPNAQRQIVGQPGVNAPTGGLADLIPGLAGITSFLSAVGSFLTAAGNPGFWARVGLGILGTALLVLGLYGLIHKANVITVATSTAAKVVPNAG